MSQENGAGFVPPGATIRLVFDDPDWKGAEIRCRGKVPLRTALQFAALADMGGSVKAEDMERVAQTFQQFGDDILIDWNVRSQRGEVLTADGEGFAALGFDDCVRIVNAWVEGIQQLATFPLAATASGSSAPSARPGRRRRAPS